MKKYAVEVRRRVIEVYSFEIEAESAHHAKDEIERLSNDGDLDFERNFVDKDTVYEEIMPDIEEIN